MQFFEAVNNDENLQMRFKKFRLVTYRLFA